MNTRHILFITGAFVSNQCWDAWKAYVEERGFAADAPPWLYKNTTVEELRERHPNNNRGLALLSLNELIEYYADIAQRYPEKPIVIGHSLGGLIAQILLNRELACAAVAIHPAPPLGVIPIEFSFYKASWKSLGLFTSAAATYMMSYPDWQYAFVNGMRQAEQRLAYERYAIPESKRVIRGGLSKAAQIDFAKAHAPLLIMAGGKDTIIPASLNRRNYKRYKNTESICDYKEFPDRNHFVLGQPGWESNAAFILRWLNEKVLVSLEAQ